MATTDRLDNLDALNETTDRLGQTVILGNAVLSSVLDSDAALTPSFYSESEAFSAFNINAQATADFASPYVMGALDGAAQGALTMVPNPIATGLFDMEAVGVLSMLSATEDEDMNVIINGDFDFWQRGTSLSAATSTRYLADRFLTSASVNSTVAPSQQSFTLGQTDVPGEPTYFHRTVVVAGATNANNSAIFQQQIESVRTFAGQAAVLSFWMKADASKNVAVEFTQFFGTGGAPSSEVTAIGVTTLALTTSWQKFTVLVTPSSITGKTLGTDNNDRIRVNIWLSAGSGFNARTDTLGEQSGTFDIAQVKFESGSVVTPFVKRLPATELALCQRYYETGAYSFTLPVNNADCISSYYQWVDFKVTKRSTPSVTGTNNEGTFDTLSSSVNGTRIGHINAVANRTISGTYIADAEL